MLDNDGFMRASDAFAWYQESDPALRSTIVAVLWLDRAPDWQLLLGRMETASLLISRFRQRVVEPPVRLATPRWVTDEAFDLSWHLRRVAAPAPRSAAAVLELARLEAMTGFDRTRPLWVFTLVEDMAGGRAALIMKVHHSLTDGQGAMKLIPTLFDAEPAPLSRPQAPPPAEPTRGGLVPASLAHNWNQAVELLGHGVRAAVPAGLRALRDPVGTATAVVETVRSVAATVAPVLDPLSPVMRGRGPGRALEIVAVDLGDLKRVAHSGAATVNDAFLTAITGAMRRYHILHGAPADQLRVTMPVSIRTEADAAASNRITLLRFALPVADPDPMSRMRRIHYRSRQISNARSLPFTDAIAAGLDLLPSAVSGSILKRVDFLASDVTGVPAAIYLAGATVTAYSAFGPTMGSAANFTLMSYAGTCHVAATIDTGAVRDPEEFASCLREGFEEVVQYAPAPAGVRMPVRDGEFPSSKRAPGGGPVNSAPSPAGQPVLLG